MLNVVTSTKDLWKNLNFSNLVSDLEESIASIAKCKQESEKSRIELVQNMRDFRKDATDEQRKASSLLIKRFQTEVDQLTKRSAHAEDLFLSICKEITTMPDPTLALTEAEKLSGKAMKAKDLEIENKNLKQKVTNLETDLTELKKMESSLMVERQKNKEFEFDFNLKLSEVLEQKKIDIMKNLKDREEKAKLIVEDSEFKIEELKNKNSELHKSLESALSQLYEIKSSDNKVNLGKDQEIVILLGDLESKKIKIAQLENEIKSLSRESGKPKSSENEEVLRLQQKLLSVENEIMSKDNYLRDAQDSLNSHMAKSEQTITDLNLRYKSLYDEYCSNKTELNNCHEELSKMSDYEQLKHELSLYTQVESACVPIPLQTKEAKFSMEDERNQVQGKESIEQRLLKKNRSLDAQLSTAKVKMNEMNCKLQAAELKEDRLLSDINEKSQLIKRLEADLTNLSSSMIPSGTLMSPVQFIGDASHPGSPLETSYTQMADATGRSLLGVSHPINLASVGQSTPVLEQILPQVSSDINDALSESSALSQSSPLPVPASGAKCTLCNIMQAQRDRYRQKFQQLDEENASMKVQIRDLQTNQKGLRDDSVKLYEKIKYLQSQSLHPKNSKSPSTSTNIQLGNTEDDISAKYSSAYEEKLNPFEQFEKRERQRYYSRMQPYDKLMYSASRVIMGSPKARLFTVLYLAFLHLIVFFASYTSVQSTSQLDSKCMHEYQDHMRKFHDKMGNS